jgi:hypothetical protein
VNQFIYFKYNYSLEKIEQNDVGVIINNFVNSTQSQILLLKNNCKINVSKEKYIKFDIAQSGDEYQFKLCDRCFKRLPSEDFSGNRLKKGGIVTKRPSCKSCRKINDGKKISNAARKEWEKINPKDFEVFICPICSKTNISGIKKIVLDHNHKTGEVRGYLCESCNTGIGRFDDDPEIIDKAKKWVLEN